MIVPPLAPGDRKVPWLNECSSKWLFKPLKYFCHINSHVLSEATEPDTEFRYIDIGSVTSEGRYTISEPMRFSEAPSRARRLLVDGDVLISTVRTYLRAITSVEKVRERLVCSTGFAVMSGNCLVAPRFLAYWVRSNLFVDEIVSRSVGVSYPAINASDIGNLPFPILELDHQRTIATYLDRETARVDGLIEKKQRQIELLKEKRAALISHAVTKGLNPDVKMRDSGIEWLGEIPEHWDMIPLKFALKPCGDAVKTGPFGSQLLSSEMVSGTVKVYNQRNVLDSDLSLGESYISEHKYHELKAFTVFPGDVLVTTRGTIGHCALFPENAELGILHPCLMRIQTNASILLPDYLSMLIQDGGIVLLQLRHMSNATTIDVIYSDSLKSVRLPVPPVHEQKEILSWLETVITRQESMLAKVELSIDMLREYRMALISAAVTGKIDVRGESRQ